MSGVLEAVARLAWDTFRASDKSGLLQKVRRIREAASALTIGNVGIQESQIRQLGPESTYRAPVGFVEVFEDDVLAIGAFLLKENAMLPMHNHPTMHGVLKVIHGTVRIRSFDLLEKEKGEKLPKFVTSEFQYENLRKLRFRSEIEYTADTEPCLVTPREGNIHSVEAVGGPAIFIDFISPPYNPPLDRDCDYFMELPVSPVPEEGVDTSLAWAKKIPCPDTYFCVVLEYFGPRISMKQGT